VAEADPGRTLVLRRRPPIPRRNMA